MTTRDFIARTYNTTATRDRQCSSVFTDYDGNVYSYGYHYPLLFNIGGLDFINVQGYSSTTARHIHWARQAEPYAIEVELRGARLPLTLDDIEAKLGARVVELKQQLDSKKRKNTQVYASLEHEFNKVLANYHTVKEAN